MKKIKFPTPYTVLVIVMIFAATLTWLLPSGGYDTLWYDKGKDVFVIQSVDKTQEVPATKQLHKESQRYSLHLSREYMKR